MKILYAIQATGNGHLVRAREIVPKLKEKVEVDVMMSGYQGDVSLPFDIKYQYHGLSFIFGNDGNINYYATWKKLKSFKLLNDIYNCPVEDYDLVVSDFEPISSWACKVKKVNCTAFSHQASFISKQAPRPNRIEMIGEQVLRSFAPADRYVGVHFEKYDEQIETPIIRKEIRKLHSYEGGYGLVYLPAYSDDKLINLFSQVDQLPWRIFSKNAKVAYKHSDISVFPVGSDHWLKSFEGASAVVMGAGFEGPSEALYLGKKLMVVPMRGQYEQICNAAAMQKLGVSVNYQLSNNFKAVIKHWLSSEAVHIPFKYNSDAIVERILSGIS